MSDIRVLLVDDHPVVRAGLRAMLADLAGIVVVAEASDGDRALGELQRLSTLGESVDLVLMDLQMGSGMDGVTATSKIKASEAGTPPPPVLIPSVATLDALAEQVPDEVRALVEAYWPGGLTVILRARSTLSWDLGETRGTVALRMPAHPIALELLAETGPLAVSSANATGEPPATTAAAAEAMLGDAVAVYLDAGEGGTQASTIVDATALESPQGKLRIVRSGVIPDADIVRVVGADRCA